jgi:hypothetical protein
MLPPEKIFDTMIPVSQDFINAVMDSVPIDMYPDVDKSIIETYQQLKDEFLDKLETISKEE